MSIKQCELVRPIKMSYYKRNTYISIILILTNQWELFFFWETSTTFAVKKKLRSTSTCLKMLPTMISCMLLKGCSLRLQKVIENTLNEQHTVKFKLLSIYEPFPFIHSLCSFSQSTVWKYKQCNRSSDFFSSYDYRDA